MYKHPQGPSEATTKQVNSIGHVVNPIAVAFQGGQKNGAAVPELYSLPSSWPKRKGCLPSIHALVLRTYVVHNEERGSEVGETYE